MPADRANSREFACTRREVPVQRLCPGDKQLDCAVAQYVVRFVPAGHWNIQRWNTIDMLTLDAEDFAARRDDRGVDTVRQKRFGQSCHLADEVLAIV